MNVYDKYMIYSADMTKTVILSTASPFKFNKTVAKAIFGQNKTDCMNEFELLNYLSENTGWEIPEALKDLDKKTVLHNNTVDKADMKNILIGLLNK